MTNKPTFMLVAGACALLLASPGTAQEFVLPQEPGPPDIDEEETPPVLRNLVTVSPGFEWAGSTGYSVRPELRYHRFLGYRLALNGGVSVGFASDHSLSLGDAVTVTYDDSQAKHTSFGLRLGLDWYPLGDGMNGVYLGPRFGVDRGWTRYQELPDIDATFEEYSVGVAVGWRWIWDPGFSFYLGMNTAFVHRSDHIEVDSGPLGDFRFDDTDSYGRIGFEFGFGWAF